ncbi:MAG TPA: hypothetical protein VFC19_37915 [Candidatus Limnocylindrales bacterium]|nr:hypothetical protein [Candidatus Limnocylindrales bacterium]
MTEGKGPKLTSVCANCGTPRDPSERCPRCGNTPEALAAEIARVNKAIADMNQEDLRLKTELKKISQQMQAALHQRTLLVNTEAERQKKSTPRQRPWSRRTTQEPPAGTGLPPTPPRQRRRVVPPAATRFPEEPHLEPETSTRSVQNVLLALAPLLIGVTAIIFAFVDLNLAAGGRIAILLALTALMLVAAPLMMSRRLFSTAESLASIGLGLLPVTGYVVSTLPAVRAGGVPPPTIFGTVFAATTVVAFVFHQATALTSARYMIVIASQPVLPLLAWEYIKGPTGWALVLGLVALQNALIARALEHFHRPTPTPAGTTTHYLWEITWVLHGLAIGSAAVYALSALLTSTNIAAGLRAATALLLVALVGLFGSLMLRRRPLGDLAAGAVTLAVIGSAARVAFIAIPENAILVIAAVVFATSLTVRALPRESRRGPQVATAVALGVLTIFVIGYALKAALAPIFQAFPMWRAELDGYAASVAERAGTTGWELVVTIALLTASSALALPPTFQREGAVAGAALTALAAPASLGLGWVPTIWLLMSSAIALLAIGIMFPPSSPRGTWAHLAATVVVGLAAIGVALGRQWSTAGVLMVFALAGIALAALKDENRPVRLTDTAAGAAAFAVPGAVATGLITLVNGVSPTAALAAGFLAASTTLAVVTVQLIARRTIGIPLAIGTGLGALVITGAAFGIDEATVVDAAVGALLLVAAILLALAPSIDEGTRADRVLDGSDIAAAAVTVAIIASLARTAHLMNPSQWMFQSAVAILVVAIGIRAMPEEWRRGPATGLGVSATLLGLVAGYYALLGGVRALAQPGELWSNRVPDMTASASPFGWQVPAALVVLAIAAAAALPRPHNYDVAAAAMVLATLGAPTAMGWAWWSPIILGLAISTCYSVAAAVAIDPRAGYARLAVAIAVGIHALLASLVMLWTTAATLAMLALLAAVVAGLSAAITRLSALDGLPPPSHLEVVGGTGLVGALVMVPAAFAAYAADGGATAEPILTVSILSIFGMLGLVFLARHYLAGYLGWGTVGIAISATAVAIAALILGRPAGIYAAGATLLVVLAELLRANVHATERAELIRQARKLAGPRRWRVGEELLARSRWPTQPGSMAAAGSAVPAAIAIVSLTPALGAALIRPYDSLNAVWQGPPEPLNLVPDPTAWLTAGVLTIAAAIAAVGFGGGMTRAVSVVVPGIALTMLITPVSMDLPWPATVLSGLGVFTLCMLSVALTIPPAVDDSTRSLRAARVAVLLIGLVGGGAGLAGALATPSMTIFTFAGAVLVGLTAALGGKTQRARILGWLGGALAAQLLVLSVSLRVGAPPEWAAFAVLAVGAALIASVVLLPRFAKQESLPEASAIEWAGYTAGIIAVALSTRSPFHVAAILIGWGCILSMAAIRAGRPEQQQRLLFYTAAGGALIAFWLLRFNANPAQQLLPEGLTLPFAILAFVVGLHQLQQRPELGSWAAYGPALIAGFAPTIALIIVPEPDPFRIVALLAGGITVLIWGSVKQQRAPLAIGTAVTTIVAFDALITAGQIWLAIGIAGIVVLAIGATEEGRRRATGRYNRSR